MEKSVLLVDSCLGRGFLGVGDFCNSKSIVYSIVNSRTIQTSDWLDFGLDVGVV